MKTQVQSGESCGDVAWLGSHEPAGFVWSSDLIRWGLYYTGNPLRRRGGLFHDPLARPVATMCPGVPGEKILEMPF